MNNVQLLEVAPTKLFTLWNDITDLNKVKAVESDLEQCGMNVVSLHAVLFNKPDLELFGTASSREDMLRHASKSSSSPLVLGARIIVWGSPKQRQTNGKLYHECFEIAKNTRHVHVRPQGMYYV